MASGSRKVCTKATEPQLVALLKRRKSVWHGCFPDVDSRGDRRVLGIKETTLYFLNHKGRGPKYYKIGRYCRYRPTDVERWLETRCATNR